MSIFQDNFHLHIHLPGMDTLIAETVKTNGKLDLVIKQNKKIMATISELSEKVDLLQTTIDETQAAAFGKITELETTIQQLRDEIANGGGNAEALQAIADKLDAATADLKSTFPTPEA